MNTPAHLIIGTTAFGRTGRPGTFAAALAGSLVPDVSLYAMAAWSLYVRAIPAHVVFDELYFSPLWQGVFAVDNSFVLWGLLLAAAIWRRMARLSAFAAAGLLHLACDFPLHNEDARRQFWPLSDWVFRSPVSYWDSNRYGGIVGPLEMALVAVLAVILWRRFPAKPARGIVLGIAALELVPGILFRFMLHG